MMNFGMHPSGYHTYPDPYNNRRVREGLGRISQSAKHNKGNRLNFPDSLPYLAHENNPGMMTPRFDSRENLIDAGGMGGNRMTTNEIQGLLADAQATPKEDLGSYFTQIPQHQGAMPQPEPYDDHIMRIARSPQNFPEPEMAEGMGEGLSTEQTAGLMKMGGLLSSASKPKQSPRFLQAPGIMRGRPPFSAEFLSGRRAPVQINYSPGMM